MIQADLDHNVHMCSVNMILTPNHYRNIPGFVAFFAVTPETVTAPKELPNTEVSPLLSAVTKAAAAAEACVLSAPVKATVLVTLTDVATTESMVTFASAFSNLKMLLSRVVVNCNETKIVKSHRLPDLNKLSISARLP